MQNAVNVSGCLARAARLEQVAVEPLDVMWLEPSQRNPPEPGLDMVTHDLLIATERPRPQRRFRSSQPLLDIATDRLSRRHGMSACVAGGQRGSHSLGGQLFGSREHRA